MDGQLSRRVSAFGRHFEYFGEIPEWQFIRIVARIDFNAPNGCWVWMGALKGEYGALGLYDRKKARRRQVLAHRYIWHLLRGPLPPKIQLHHKCENKRCVNPEHLQPVTSLEHLYLTPQHIMHAGMWRGGTCPKGHPVTEENVYISAAGHRRCRICFNEWQTRRNQIIADRREIKMPVSECAKGHELAGDNLYTYNGMRFCRACHAELTARRYHEKKAERGISSSKRVYFTDLKVCRRGHDLTLPDAIYRFTLHGQPKACCLLCKLEANRATEARRKLAHANDVRPPRRKPGPKPRIAQAVSGV